MAKRLLLDTHVFLWWSIGDPRLGRRAANRIRDPDNTVLVSAASAWEIATKHRLGKLPEAQTIVKDLPDALRQGRFEPLSITVEHALAAGSLDGPHRDPFDRVLIAQCRIEGIPIVSADPIFKAYRVRAIW